MRAQRIDHVPYTHDTLELLNPDQVLESLASASVIVNCAVVREGTRQQCASVNIFAPVLAAMAAPQASMIHISEDCISTRPPRHVQGIPVASPIEPRLRSEWPKDSVFARTKATAERYLYGRAAIIRTAFVGERNGLLRWFLDLPYGANIVGYDAAFWSGSHVDAVASRIAAMAGDPPRPGIYHLATDAAITKREALDIVRRAYDREDVVIRPGGPAIDRSLVPSGEPLPSLAEWMSKNPPSPDRKQKRPGGISR